MQKNYESGIEISRLAFSSIISRGIAQVTPRRRMANGCKLCLRISLGDCQHCDWHARHGSKKGSFRNITNTFMAEGGL